MYVEHILSAKASNVDLFYQILRCLDVFNGAMEDLGSTYEHLNKIIFTGRDESLCKSLFSETISVFCAIFCFFFVKFHSVFFCSILLSSTIGLFSVFFFVQFH